MKDVWELTRLDTNETVVLPREVKWLDELTWSKVAQADPVQLLGGDVDIQQGEKLAGRTISLGGEAWFTRAMLLTLQAWTNQEELEMRLTHDEHGSFDVIWRLHEGAFSDLSAVSKHKPETALKKYRATLNFMEINRGE